MSYNWTQVAMCISDLQSALSHMRVDLLISAINRTVLTGPIKYQLYSYHNGIVSHMYMPELYGNRHDVVTKSDSYIFYYIFAFLFILSMFFNIFCIFNKCRPRGYLPIG